MRSMKSKAVAGYFFQVYLFSSTVFWEEKTDNRSDEERVAMAVQMRDECCTNASFLDLDRVLKELQEKVADATEFSRIGPFGILPAASPALSEPSPEPLPQLETVPNVQVVEQTGRISTPDLNLSLSQFAWGELDDVQAWDTLDSALVTFSRLNSEKGSINGDISANWELAIGSPSQYFLNDAATIIPSSQHGPNAISQSLAAFETGTGNLILPHRFLTLIRVRPRLDSGQSGQPDKLS